MCPLRSKCAEAVLGSSGMSLLCCSLWWVWLHAEDGTEWLRLQVGLMEVSSEQVAKRGLTGRGLKLLHHYPDLLWGLGSKSTPDDSFTPGRVFPQVEQSFQSLCYGHAR